MGDVLVKRATLSGSRVERMVVGIERLPDRTIDRAQAVRWMLDGHSLVPLLAGVRGSALQLVELEEGHAIRTDNRAIDEDLLPPLPPV